MGREVKRVPLDFSLSIGKVWDGFINPLIKLSHPCKECEGTGLNPYTKKILDRVKFFDKAKFEAGAHYGYCGICNGEGEIWESAQAKYDYENWERVEPPTGEGWQMWETVSDGSPVSPVFKTPEELARWLTNNPNNSVTDGTPYEAWLSMITGPGWAPSAISVPGKGFVSGVEGMFSS